jgi:hypothetical protein
MLDRTKGLTMAEIQEMVQKGADIFEKAENRARTTKAQFRSLRKMFETIRDGGVVGALECQALAGECDALATQFEADVWALHRKLTLRAQELGIDLPTRDGGR